MIQNKRGSIIIFILIILFVSCTGSDMTSAITEFPTQIPTSTIEPKPTIFPTKTIQPSAIPTLHYMSEGFSKCMVFELEIVENLDLGGSLQFFQYGKKMVDTVSLNEKEIILKTINDDQITINLIEKTDEQISFSINDQLFQFNTGALLMLSFFEEGDEKQILLWVPQLNQFVFNPVIQPPALRLGIRMGVIDDSPPSYFQSPNWCVEEAKAYYKTFSSAIEEMEDRPSAADEKFKEETEKFIRNGDARNDCFSYIFPDYRVYSWGRSDSGEVVCPELISLK